MGTDLWTELPKPGLDWGSYADMGGSDKFASSHLFATDLCSLKLWFQRGVAEDRTFVNIPA